VARRLARRGRAALLSDRTEAFKTGQAVQPTARQVRLLRRSVSLSKTLSELRRADLQDFADRLLGDGTDASTIWNALMPLRAIFRRAVARGDVAVNPASGLELPAVRGRRDRIASPEEGREPDRGTPRARARALGDGAVYRPPTW
jgi:site-specific recombinase XerC